jgi:formamidopyrimidine-DNA glycosylase
MPELPEVETVVRGLRADVIGRTLKTFWCDWPRLLATTDSTQFAARIEGQQVLSLGRRGKYIVFTLTHDLMLIHLKMTGRLYVAQPGARPDDRWVHVKFQLDNGNELRFSDSRKFGRVYIASDLEEIIGKLGPEPLEPEFTAEAFASALTKRKGIIKSLLLDQTLVAGVGNIYADEALWLAQIDPHRRADTLEREMISRLHAAIIEVLSQGIKHEGASVNWYRKPDGTTGESQNHFKVYDRQDNPCVRCGTPIRKIWLGQRGTHYCPGCQN